MKHTILILFFLVFCVASIPVLDSEILDKTKKDHEKVSIGTVMGYKGQKKFAWRFLHKDGVLMVGPFWSNGSTWSQYELVETQDLDKCKAEIEKMELAVSISQQSEIDALESIPKEKTPKNK